MAKRKENPWQFKFSFALAVFTLVLVFGYFTQSFLEIRKVKPVSVAIERVRGASQETGISPEAPPTMEKGDKEVTEQ